MFDPDDHALAVDRGRREADGFGDPQTGRVTDGQDHVVDRLIQQAVLQVLQELWDPTFSEHSYGFRPGRSAHQAVAQAQRYVAEGYNIVVDLDLEKFFDDLSDYPRIPGETAKRSPLASGTLNS